MTFTYGYDERSGTPFHEACVALFPDGTRIAATAFDGDIWIPSKDGIYYFIYQLESFDEMEGVACVNRHLYTQLQKPRPLVEGEESPF